MIKPMVSDKSLKSVSGNGHARRHVVLVVPRGEAVRNFLYSDTLRTLSEHVDVTLLSVMHDQQFCSRFMPYCRQIIPLEHHGSPRAVGYLRLLVDTAHDRWLGSEVAKNRGAIRDHEAAVAGSTPKRLLLKSAAIPVATKRNLEVMSQVERHLSWMLRPNDIYLDLFRKIKPDLVFNCSHIHGPAADLPVRAAHHLGIPTCGFIFSWDNLTSRSRIFVPYNYYLVWHEKMKGELSSIYSSAKSDNTFVMGTPQFDFHFKPEFQLSREELCQRIGADPRRPIVLYTTGIDKHFPEEHRHVEKVAQLLDALDVESKPQLIVRTYVKGTSAEMRALAKKGLPGVVFPTVLWEEKWFTPQYEDLSTYTSLLRHASLGINVASTVSLELLIHDKPVINIGFDPPGSSLNPLFRYSRHLDFDHYRPVVESQATMVARSINDMREMLCRGLTRPEEGSEKRKLLIQQMFGSSLDGHAGERIALKLIELANQFERSHSDSER